MFTAYKLRNYSNDDCYVRDDGTVFIGSDADYINCDYDYLRQLILDDFLHLNHSRDEDILFYSLASLPSLLPV